ncbi:MAG: PEGA domain-containing protein, partial [Defluviitaleaceae bacterium]|nr:PEGA domain-containing protein [Defluviitaleaceae bacterium]
MNDKDNPFPDYPLTGPGEDDDGEDFFLTSGGDEEPLTFEPFEESYEEEPPAPSSRRPMFERVTPPPERSPSPRLEPTRPPIARPTRLDPQLISRLPRRKEAPVEDRRDPPPTGLRRAPRPKKLALRKKRFAALYIFAMVIGVAGFLIFFLLHFPSIRERTTIAAPAPTPTPTPEIVIPIEARTLMAQITRINVGTASSGIEVVDLATGLRQSFYYTDTTDMTNIHGRPMHFGELEIGQLVDISFDARTDNLLSAHQSRDAWERRLQTNLRIDLENDTITAGIDQFTFSHHLTMVLYRGHPFPIAHIQPENSVTLLGYGNRVWLIQLDAGHGFLQVANAYRVQRGTIEIGNQFLSLFELGLIQLQEGRHSVVVNGDNIETFVQTIEIQQGETFLLNLNDAQLRTGHLHINTTPEDAMIFINGERHEGTGPARLEFGEYIIRVESYGYITQEQIVNVTGTMGSITFELEEAARMGMLRVVTLPTNAQIFIDGVFVGHSELLHELPLGSYTIVARLPGYEETPVGVDIVPGETERVILLTRIQVSPWPPATPAPPYDGNPFPTPAPPPPPIGG